MTYPWGLGGWGQHNCVFLKTLSTPLPVLIVPVSLISQSSGIEKQREGFWRCTKSGLFASFYHEIWTIACYAQSCCLFYCCISVPEKCTDKELANTILDVEDLVKAGNKQRSAALPYLLRTERSSKKWCFWMVLLTSCPRAFKPPRPPGTPACIPQSIRWLLYIFLCLFLLSQYYSWSQRALD